LTYLTEVSLFSSVAVIASQLDKQRPEMEVSMYVKINRNVCPSQLALCERCLGRFLTFPMGYERRCFEVLKDDGSEVLTIELHSGDNDLVLTLSEEQRLRLAGNGWTGFVPFEVPMYRNEVH
jgi:hypothetical protein